MSSRRDDAEIRIAAFVTVAESCGAPISRANLMTECRTAPHRPAEVQRRTLGPRRDSLLPRLSSGYDGAANARSKEAGEA